MKKTAIILVGIGVVIGIVLGASYSILQSQDKASKLNHLTYKNTNYWFGLNPPVGWTIDESGQNGGAVNFKYTNTEGYSVVLDIDKPHKFSAGQTLEHVVQQTINDINDNSPNYMLISNTSRIVNYMNGYEIVYSIQENNITGKQVLIEKGDTFFFVTYTANDNTYDEYVAIVNDSINSMTIV